MKANFDPQTDTISNLLVWVRIPSLPLEYFEEVFLMKLGAKIGRLIRVDEATSVVSRGRSARLYVELDLSKPLLSKFMLRRRIRRIEYEGMHMVCFGCGLFGHRQQLLLQPHLQPMIMLLLSRILLQSILQSLKLLAPGCMLHVGHDVIPIITVLVMWYVPLCTALVISLKFILIERVRNQCHCLHVLRF